MHMYDLSGLEQSDLEWLAVNIPEGHPQWFSHTELATGKTRHFDVTNMQEAILKERLGQPTMIVIPRDLYEQVLTSQGIELHHLANITPDQAAYDPCIVCCIGDEHVIVDGNHKLVKAYQMGLRSRPAILLSEVEWSRFLIVPPPRVEAMLNKFVITGQVV